MSDPSVDTSARVRSSRSTTTASLRGSSRLNSRANPDLTACQPSVAAALTRAAPPAPARAINASGSIYVPLEFHCLAMMSLARQYLTPS